MIRAEERTRSVAYFEILRKSGETLGLNSVADISADQDWDVGCLRERTTPQWSLPGGKVDDAISIAQKRRVGHAYQEQPLQCAVSEISSVHLRMRNACVPTRPTARMPCNYKLTATICSIVENTYNWYADEVVALAH